MARGPGMAMKMDMEMAVCDEWGLTREMVCVTGWCV